MLVVAYEKGFLPRKPLSRTIIFFIKFTIALLIFSCLLQLGKGYAQRTASSVKNVKVIITDDKGEPLEGATILLKGTTKGVKSDAAGNLSLDASPNSTLVISYVGFETTEVEINNQASVSVQLKPSMVIGEQVIVVGYGTQKKSDITGAVASLPRDRLEMVPNNNIAEALQGSIPGVMIQTTTAGAQPNQSIQIRGRNSITASNDPLIVLDGIPYGGQLADINPNDIQSIEVLKDASSAAIYGSRGANGVILITSKQGIAGKTTISYDGKYSTQNATNLSRFLTGPEFYAFKMERSPNLMTASEKAMFDSGNWTNWMDLALRQGSRHDHNLAVSGNHNNTKYYIGGGYMKVKGIAKNDEFRRISARINVETKINDWLTLGTRTQLTFDDASGEPASFVGALQTNPLTTPYDSNGRLTILPWPEQNVVGNPLQGLLYEDLNKSTQILTNNYAQINFPFVKGLSYRLNTGIRKTFTDRAQYRGRNTQSGLESLGRSTTSNSVSNNTVIENILSYNRDFGNHTIFATALYSYEGNKNSSNSLSASNYPNDFLMWYSSQQADVRIPSTSFIETNLISQMARLNYSYASKYLVTLTGRRDGYSGFGATSKWGVFPSAALGWNLAKENFFPLKNLFNELKLRASWGLNGNQAIGAYETISRLAVENMVAGNRTQPGYIPVKLGLDDLGWESSRVINLGLDFGILKNRVSGNINWYLTNTTDLLLDRTISAVHGITTITQNIGETENTGLELSLNTKNVVTNKFQWSTSGNVSFNKNKIVSLYGLRDANGREIDDVANRWFIGQPIRVNYDYIWEGVWQLDEATEAAKYGSKPGYVKLKDFDKDGVLRPEDRRIIGQRDPKLLWGLTNTFSYSNFTLNVFVHGVHGVTTQNFLMTDEVQGAEVRNNTLLKNWWTPTNPTNGWIMNKLEAARMAGNLGRIYESSNFIRLKDISLAYDLPKSLIDKASISRLRLFVTGRNLATFTNWTGMDPELTEQASQLGVPLQKEYVFGVTLGF
jgi:TonB-linked SusC/RagA family outer membrane protein